MTTGVPPVVPAKRVRVGLVGCVKTKRSQATVARDLYDSYLFRGRRSYVESSCGRWWILSAKHGLVDPDAVLAPYEQELTTASAAERRRWSGRVLEQLDDLGLDYASTTFESTPAPSTAASGSSTGSATGPQSSRCPPSTSPKASSEPSTPVRRPMLRRRAERSPPRHEPHRAGARTRR